MLKPRSSDHLQRLAHAFQVAAEEIAAVRVHGLAASREQHGGVVGAAVALRHGVPRLLLGRQVVQRIAVPGVVLGVAVPEPVGEDLVDDRVLRPRRRCESGVVGGLRVAPVANVGSSSPQAAVERGRVVGVVGGRRPVGDDEAVPVDVRLRSSASSPARSRRSRLRARLVARDAAGDALHRPIAAGAGVHAVVAERHAGDVVVERAEADLHRRPGRHRALRRPVEGVARVEPRPSHSTLLSCGVAGLDRQDVRVEL